MSQKVCAAAHPMRVDGKLELAAMLEQNGKRTCGVRGRLNAPLAYALGDVSELMVIGGATTGMSLSLRLEDPEEHARLKIEE